MAVVEWDEDLIEEERSVVDDIIFGGEFWVQLVLGGDRDVADGVFKPVVEIGERTWQRELTRFDELDLVQRGVKIHCGLRGRFAGVAAWGFPEWDRGLRAVTIGPRPVAFAHSIGEVADVDGRVVAAQRKTFLPGCLEVVVY